MTRLITEWVRQVIDNLNDYDNQLKECFNYSLLDLAASTVRINPWDLQKQICCLKVAVVPITAGQGIISDFAQSVAAIIKYLGASVIVTEQTDVCGIFEAYQEGSDVIFMADDIRYIAFNCHNGKMAENNDKTALGYSCALAKAVGGLKGKKILLIGLGLVGKSALKHLKNMGAECILYDTNSDLLAEYAKNGYAVINDKKEISGYQYIFEATPCGEWLSADLLQSAKMIVSPGVPCCLDVQSRSRYKHHFINDYLEIGTAAMLAGVL